MTIRLFKILAGVILLYSLSSFIKADAQTNETPQKPADVPKLTGSRFKSEELIVKSDAIFSGQILSLSAPDFAATGNSVYGAKIQVLKILKGNIAPLINVALRVQFGSWAGERKPELNHPYIFFVTISQSDNSIEVLKLLDATADDVAHVTALIAQAPKQ
jgi:hypothetical protein